MTTYHAHNLEAFITEAINAGDNVENFDIDAIIDELNEKGIYNGGDAENMADFWEVVANHAN